ncbi:MAG: iron-containing alcohol dehydrogenase, partial [Lachnospiraceae bacterium]
MSSENTLTVLQDGKPCYDIVYEKDLSGLTKALTDRGLDTRRTAIITDTNVAPLYAQQVASLFPGKPLIYAIPAGEENKTLSQIQEIYRFLIENHFDRSSLLAALGGGVVGDMTGFAAATYLRGIDFIQIPTTLLAQADSS